MHKLPVRVSPTRLSSKLWLSKCLWEAIKTCNSTTRWVVSSSNLYNNLLKLWQHKKLSSTLRHKLQMVKLKKPKKLSPFWSTKTPPRFNRPSNKLQISAMQARSSKLWTPLHNFKWKGKLESMKVSSRPRISPASSLRMSIKKKTKTQMALIKCETTEIWSFRNKKSIRTKDKLFFEESLLNAIVKRLHLQRTI